MTERAKLIDSFLAAKGWDGAERTALAGDASFRRYFRLTLGNRGAAGSPPGLLLPRSRLSCYFARQPRIYSW